MAPDLQSRRLSLAAQVGDLPASPSTRTRLLGARQRLMATVARWRAVEVRDSVVGSEDVEWVWSFLRRRGGYHAKGAR
jgi:hypothetical protein